MDECAASFFSVVYVLYDHMMESSLQSVMHIYIYNQTIACLLLVFSLLSGLVVPKCSISNKTKLPLFSVWYVYPVVHHTYLCFELYPCVRINQNLVS